MSYKTSRSGDFHFLALLNLSSEVMKSNFAGRPSFVPHLSLYLMHGFVYFSSCLPWDIRSIVSWILKTKKQKKFLQFLFLFTLAWEPMGANIPNATPQTNRNRKFEPSTELCSQRSSQTIFGFLKLWEFILINDFFPFALPWDPMEANILKHYCSHQLQPTVWTFPEFSYQRPSQKHACNFWNVENLNLNDFFSFSLTCDSIEVKI